MAEDRLPPIEINRMLDSLIHNELKSVSRIKKLNFDFKKMLHSRQFANFMLLSYHVKNSLVQLLTTFSTVYWLISEKSAKYSSVAVISSPLDAWWVDDQEINTSAYKFSLCSKALVS